MRILAESQWWRPFGHGSVRYLVLTAVWRISKEMKVSVTSHKPLASIGMGPRKVGREAMSSQRARTSQGTLVWSALVLGGREEYGATSRQLGWYHVLQGPHQRRASPATYLREQAAMSRQTSRL